MSSRRTLLSPDDYPPWHTHVLCDMREGVLCDMCERLLCDMCEEYPRGPKCDAYIAVCNDLWNQRERIDKEDQQSKAAPFVSLLCPCLLVRVYIKMN